MLKRQLVFSLPFYYIIAAAAVVVAVVVYSNLNEIPSLFYSMLGQCSNLMAVDKKQKKTMNNKDVRNLNYNEEGFKKSYNSYFLQSTLLCICFTASL